MYERCYMTTFDWLIDCQFSNSGASGLLQRCSPARRRWAPSSRRFLNLDWGATSPTGRWDCFTLKRKQVRYWNALLLWWPTTLNNTRLMSVCWEEPEVGDLSTTPVSPGMSLFAEAARSLRGEVLTGLLTDDLAQKWWLPNFASPSVCFNFWIVFCSWSHERFVESLLHSGKWKKRSND